MSKIYKIAEEAILRNLDLPTVNHTVYLCPECPAKMPPECAQFPCPKCGHYSKGGMIQSVGGLYHSAFRAKNDRTLSWVTGYPQFVFPEHERVCKWTLVAPFSGFLTMTGSRAKQPVNKGDELQLSMRFLGPS